MASTCETCGAAADNNGRCSDYYCPSRPRGLYTTTETA